MERDETRLRRADVRVLCGDPAASRDRLGAWRSRSSRPSRTHSRPRAGPGGRPVSKRRAFITGITGQDGCYLAELLLQKGYEVYGMSRRATTENVERINHLGDRVTLHQGDLLDQSSLIARSRWPSPKRCTTSPPRCFVADVAGSRPVLIGGVHRLSACTRMLEAVRRSVDARRSASTRRRRRRCSARCARCRRPRRRRSTPLAVRGAPRCSATTSR